MGRLTEAQLEIALNAAALMRDRGKDPDHVATALLVYDAQLQQLQRVVTTVQAYMHSGMAEHEHAELVKALELYSESEHHGAARFGLE